MARHNKVTSSESRDNTNGEHGGTHEVTPWLQTCLGWAALAVEMGFARTRRQLEERESIGEGYGHQGNSLPGTVKAESRPEARDNPEFITSFVKGPDGVHRRRE